MASSNHVSKEMWSLFVAILLIIYTALGKSVDTLREKSTTRKTTSFLKLVVNPET